jgi:hypothetical protein
MTSPLVLYLCVNAVCPVTYFKTVTGFCPQCKLPGAEVQWDPAG